MNAKTMTAAQAKASGYAEFNGYDHLCVDVPDGGFTISAKTSEGKRVTFCFCPYRDGGPPQCVDVVYHDSGMSNAGGPTFDALGFSLRQPDIDTRKLRPDGPTKPGIVAILLDTVGGEG